MRLTNHNCHNCCGLLAAPVAERVGEGHGPKGVTARREHEGPVGLGGDVVGAARRLRDVHDLQAAAVGVDCARQ